MNIQTTQIGGKGTVRRKKKRTGHIFKDKDTKESREYSIKIKNINKMISELTDEEYIFFKKYIGDELEDLGFSIEKHNFLKQYKNEFNICKEDPNSYVYSLLVLNIDKPMEFNPTSFHKLKKLFEQDHLVILIKFIYDTESALNKKIFIEN